MKEAGSKRGIMAGRSGFERFIATRLSNKSLPGYTRPLIRIAIAGVALSMAVMILSVAIVTGFQREVRHKVAGFAGHIQISRYDANESWESKPVSISQPFYPEIDIPDVEHIQVFATKAGIIKTDEQIEGSVLKGISTDYDWGRFSGELKRGNVPYISDTGRSDEVLISAYLADRLALDTGMDVRMYFVSEGSSQLRGRKFHISGVYDSGMEEFDRMFVIGDIRHVQRLNNWKTDEISGFELFISDFDRLEESVKEVYQEIGYDLDARTVAQLYPQIFDWLKLQDMNVLIILVLMISVSAITMISALLIIILERASLIGVLKSMGARNKALQRIFLIHALRIIVFGLAIGNFAGLGLGWVQHYFGIFRLSQESYYVSHIPVHFSLLPILILNAGTIVLCLLALYLPTMIISRIQPVKVIAMR